jgi:uncharacterized protein (TIGR03437 family)
MKRAFRWTFFASIVWVSAVHAQTPTITAVVGESGSKSLSPGGIAFVQGANLGGLGTTVTVGTNKAFVFNANGGGTSLQIELPVNAALGPTTLTAGASAPFNITLVQYSPGIAINNNIAQAYHYASQQLVTPAFPASPNEQIAVIATGLGPTNPVYATGTSPSDSSAVAVTLPTVAVQGKTAAVSTAFLEPGSPGFYAVVFTTPGTVTAGNQNITVSIGGLSSETGSLPIATGPIIGSVTNAASYIDPTLPNGGIAQGSIAVIKGVNLGPANLSVASNAFQNSILSGTSVSITVGGTTVAGLLYYTSSTQVAFLLPSNTPAGTGTITATYNGQAGPAAPIAVVTSNLGIFTATSDGQGAGIVTNGDYSLVSATKAPNCGGPYTTCGAANPGDTLVLWATGLGPVSGSDAAGAGLGVNMANIPLTLWLGGVQAQVTYQGRSGCCIGEDEIVFVVPAGVPTGCAVPLAVQIGSEISNYTFLPVAPKGTRTCAASNSTFTSSLVQALTTSTAALTHGEIDLSRQPNVNGQGQITGNTDYAQAQFLSFTVPAAIQPFIISYIDDLPRGTCAVYNSLNGLNAGNYLTNVNLLDAGPSVKVTGPNGSQTVLTNAGQITLAAAGTFLAPGVYTLTGTGGANVGGFTTQFTIPTPPTLTSPASGSNISVTRANGMTLAWTGGAANAVLQIQGQSPTDNTITIGASFNCFVAASAGTFTVPANILLALPAGGFGGLNILAYSPYGTFSSSGLNHGSISANYSTLVFTTLK